MTSKRYDASSRRAAPHEIPLARITAVSMEVGPTAHYAMGGVRVDPETAATTVPGLYAAGEVAGGMHGSNRLGGNSLSDLVVFGRRAGLAAAEFALAKGGSVGFSEAELDAAAADAVAPFDGDAKENPYAVHRELQDMMQALVGIIRTQSELQEASEKLEVLKERTRHVSVDGNRQFNPGWHLALDLRSMLTVATLITQGALIRQESRGGHTRDDFPDPDYAHWGKVNLVQRDMGGGQIAIREEPLPEMPADLAKLFEEE